MFLDLLSRRNYWALMERSTIGGSAKIDQFVNVMFAIFGHNLNFFAISQFYRTSLTSQNQTTGI